MHGNFRFWKHHTNLDLGSSFIDPMKFDPTHQAQIVLILAQKSSFQYRYLEGMK